MSKRLGSLIRFCVTGFVAVALFAAAHPAVPAQAASSSPQRIFGVSRYETSTAVASRWASADTVFVASGAAFPDALSAGPAATSVGGPLVLVQPEAVPSATLSRLKALAPKRIVVVGDVGAVSARVATILSGVAPVQRVGGKDRFATAAQVASLFFTRPNAAFLASGLNFPDAISGSAAASKLRSPLLLTSTAALPDSTVQALKLLKPTTVHLLGDEGVISASIASRLRSMGFSVVRHGGSTRYSTAAAIARDFWPAGFSRAYLVSGENFPDGLSVAPLAGREGVPVLLTRSDCMPAETKMLADPLALPSQTFVGGPDVASSSHFSCSSSVSQQTSVYVVPHQDDEVISMAGGIMSDVRAGRQVRVVLMYQGHATRVRETMCQNKGICLSPAEMMAARDWEFLGSLSALGVKASQVTFLRVDEKSPEVANLVDQALTRIVSMFGRDARFNSMSWLDLHNEHAMIAYGIKGRFDQDIISSARWFQSPLYQVGSSLPVGGVLNQDGYLSTVSHVGVPAPTWLNADRLAVASATKSYAVWDPASGRYAVGWQSVSGQLTYAALRSGSLSHPSGNFWTTSGLASAWTWIRTAPQNPIVRQSSSLGSVSP